jgi:ERAP1-like C-terminal domain
MAFDGYLSYDIALGVASYLTRETEYYPWYSAAIAFDKLDYLLKGTPLQEDFRTFVHYLITKMYANYGVEHVKSDSIIKQLARELANDWTCRMGDKTCLENSYNDVIKNETIPGALQITHYCHGLRHPNGSNEFQKIKDKMHATIYQTERLRIIDGLLCSTHKENLKFLLSDMLDTVTTFYRTHERRRAFNSLVARSSIGLEVLCEFIAANYNQIKSV